jgi:hypothetical protein
MIQYLWALLGCNHCPDRLSIAISSTYPLKPRRARHYQDKMLHLPKYVTQASEFAGFSELAKLLLQK